MVFDILCHYTVGKDTCANVYELPLNTGILAVIY